MADQEHVERIKQGIDNWNRWRKENREIQPRLNGVHLNKANLSNANLIRANLSRANLRRADLTGSLLSNANLIGADLSEANLSGAILNKADLRTSGLAGADLSHAYLSEANLSGANLSGTNLNETNLSKADLSRTTLIGANLRRGRLNGANLSGADLSSADLSSADLSSADLSSADLSKTILWYTTIANLDLRTVKKLTAIQHLGPSYIELFSVQLPQDGSALHFLRGAGVPDEWIDDYRARMMNPIQYHSCFISYSHQNDDLAHRLHSDLQDKGVRCWFAPHDMRIGDKIRPRIDEAIHLQDKLLLILSEEAVNSDWVEHEVETALAKERREKRTILFPIRLDDSILERPYTGWAATVQNERHIGDFTGWKDHDRYQAAFDRLIRDLKKADE